MEFKIETTYKQKINYLAALFNLSYDDAERFYVVGMRELLK
jgi:hypothetical protein